MSGQYERAITYAKRILDVEPWNEDVVRELIELWCANGSRATAIAEFRQFAERLRCEFDLEPMPNTSAALDRTGR